MRIYDALIPPYQQIVDRIVAYTRLSDWQMCRTYVASTYEALSRHGERFDAIAPEQDLSHMVAALIERLDSPEIRDGDQAAIYAISAEIRHRKLSEQWFTEHPEEYERLWSQFRTSRPH